MKLRTPCRCRGSPGCWGGTAPRRASPRARSGRARPRRSAWIPGEPSPRRRARAAYRAPDRPLPSLRRRAARRSGTGRDASPERVARRPAIIGLRFALMQNVPDFLHVFPHFLLVLRRAQQERGMVGRHHAGAVGNLPAAAELGDRVFGSEDRLCRECAERHDHLRRDQTDLLIEEGAARGDFVFLRVPVVGRAAAHRVDDVDLLAGRPHRLDDLRQQLSGGSHERQPLLVFLATRRFADEHQVRFRVSGAEDDPGTRAGKLAARAAGEKPLERLQIRNRARNEVGSRSRADEELLETEVAEELELFGKPWAVGQAGSQLPAASGERRARRVELRMRRTASQIRSATSRLLRREIGSAGPSRAIRSTSFCAASNTTSDLPTSLTTTRSAPFVSIFRRPRSSRSSVSAANATIVWLSRGAARLARRSRPGRRRTLASPTSRWSLSGIDSGMKSATAAAIARTSHSANSAARRFSRSRELSNETNRSPSGRGRPVGPDKSVTRAPRSRADSA